MKPGTKHTASQSAGNTSTALHKGRRQSKARAPCQQQAKEAISAALLNDKAGGWLNEDGAAHMSTTGGAELGSVVAHKVIEMLQRPNVVKNVGTVTDFMAKSMRGLMKRHGDIFTGVRQKGVILGLEFSNHPEGAVFVSRALYEHGVWAIFSSLDKKVLQWKPGVLLDRATCKDIIERFDAAMPRARELLHQASKPARKAKAPAKSRAGSSASAKTRARKD